MFKNMTIYKLPDAAALVQGNLDEQLTGLEFKPCGPTEASSWGFVRPSLKEGGAWAEQLGGGRVVLAVRRQDRKVPAEAIKKHVARMAEAIEKETGRKPGSKRKRELKEEALLELLPQAFTKDSTALVLIDTVGNRVGVSSTSTSMLDGVLTTLCKAVPNFAASPWNMAQSPSSWMGQVLIEPGVALGSFGLGKSLEVKSEDASQRRVAWKNANLQAEDVQKNLAAGARVVRMGLEFKDRTSFELNENGQLKKVDLDLGCFEETPAADSVVEEWRSNAELWTAELVLIANEVEELLGGVCELGGAGALPKEEQPVSDLSMGLSAGEVSEDQLYAEAVTLVVTSGTGSISALQRRLAIGYNRAARLLERMESDGVVSAMKTNGSRDVMKKAA